MFIYIFITFYYMFHFLYRNIHFLLWIKTIPIHFTIKIISIYFQFMIDFFVVSLKYFLSYTCIFFILSLHSSFFSTLNLFKILYIHCISNSISFILFSYFCILSICITYFNTVNNIFIIPNIDIV